MKKLIFDEILGAEFAKKHGPFMEYSNRVFAAYWGESQDISKDDVLARIVEEVGECISCWLHGKELWFE